MASANDIAPAARCGSAQDPDERRQLIERYLPLAHRIARRFAGRDEGVDDLGQVAAVALIRAIDRRDPARAHVLSAYVARCVEGEVRRHLRDRCGVVRIPRGLQRPGQAAPPTRVWGDDEFDSVPDADELDAVVLARVLVTSGARPLAQDERRILLLCYFLDLSQAEVGVVEGVSQVQVSRLQRRAIAKMRAHLAADETSPASSGRV